MTAYYLVFSYCHVDAYAVLICKELIVLNFICFVH